MPRASRAKSPIDFVMKYSVCGQCKKVLEDCGCNGLQGTKKVNASRKDPTAGRPLTPKEASEEKLSIIPSFVFDVFNAFLSTRSEQSSIRIGQNEVVQMLVTLKPGLDRNEVFDKGWLDIESAYRKAGWNVEFDKPGYCETYEASWEFTRKGKR